MKMKNELIVIVAAAGIGERFKSDIPKQYISVNGKSIIERSISPFLKSKYVKKIIIAINKNDDYVKDQDFYNSNKVEIVVGGNTRQESIFNALININEGECKYVITHDAARPNFCKNDINRLIADIVNTDASCSYLYSPVYDSIKSIGSEETLNKNDYLLVQTPQISKFNDLKKALSACIKKNVEAPDESFAINFIDLPVSKIRGNRSNIKITEANDVEILDKFLVRTGTGFDLHTYTKGKGIILGGFNIECRFGIKAHSDGDVLLHSIADSILGAAALGDIGKFFPDHDPKNKDLNSKTIIKFCLNEIQKLNLQIYNVDATIICESPKINPYREQIVKKLSSILKIPTCSIGLKATTAEKISIIGENKAIAVQSIVNLREKI